MKKLLVYAAIILFALLVIFALIFMLQKASDDGGSGTDNAMPVSSSAGNSELLEYANEVLLYLKDSDFAALSNVVHPEYGVVFSPYATVQLSTSKCFTSEQVKNFIRDTQKYIWGVFDGSGDPIEMTAKEYFSKFVFDADYTAATEVGINKVVMKGNALENIDEVFPKARYVDYYIEGTKEADGLDWHSLRLVFEDYNGTLMLTAIVHSVWTI